MLTRKFIKSAFVGRIKGRFVLARVDAPCPLLLVPGSPPACCWFWRPRWPSRPCGSGANARGENGPRDDGISDRSPATARGSLLVLSWTGKAGGRAALDSRTGWQNGGYSKKNLLERDFEKNEVLRRLQTLDPDERCRLAANRCRKWIGEPSRSGSRRAHLGRPPAWRRAVRRRTDSAAESDPEGAALDSDGKRHRL